jgi:two-component system invasion response regulator UvrY
MSEYPNFRVSYISFKMTIIKEKRYPSLQVHTIRAMNISIIDDHKLLTDAIEMALQGIYPDCQLSVFNRPTTFVESLREDTDVDIVITDLLMPKMSGIELIETVRKVKGDSVRIIVLTSVNDVQTIRHALRSGANAYISKDDSLTELPAAIKEVTAGGEFISPSLQRNLIKSIFTEDQQVFYLSPREKEVLLLVCSGRTVKEMAYDMGLSSHTVQTYQKKIMKKFNVNRTADLIIFAIQKGLYYVTPK